MAESQILIFGAGKIGRSFIGQLFSRNGYGVLFVDMDRSLVDELNRRKQYKVVIKGPDHEESWTIDRISAIHAGDHSRVIQTIRDTDLMAISAGKTALPAIAPVVAEGLLEREKENPGRILDIILAENMRAADLFFRDKLRNLLPPSYPLDDQVGLVETSIGKMVPIMTTDDLAADPLQVFAEPYNTLILDRMGFKGEIPRIPEFSLKEHMQAWVDRKAFIHNLGHATAAYSGYLKHPGVSYMYQVLGDPVVYDFTRTVMMESARVLLAAYPEEFTLPDLTDHMDDLLTRFRNRNLGDTVFRVGSDLPRKLGKDDRFMGAIRMAERLEQHYGTILEAMVMGFHFRAEDERGQMLPEDKAFHQSCRDDLDGVLEQVCGLDHNKDLPLINHLKQHVRKHRSA